MRFICFLFFGLGAPFCLTALGQESTAATSVDLSMGGIISRAISGGPVVTGVLFILVFMSILTWALLLAKWFYLNRVQKNHDRFMHTFWKNRTLRDFAAFNNSLKESSSTPTQALFRNGYEELIKGTQLKEDVDDLRMVLESTTNSLVRTLTKIRSEEKRQLDRYMHILAISASAAPFIGLFGTVWGIMNAFEGIARTGSASLAAVAPGISEALIATAFGLAAAIPAVIAYNFFIIKIKSILVGMDGFSQDFINIVERYLLKSPQKSEQRTVEI